MQLRPIGHDDRLSVVDHLDELRARLMSCGIVLLVVFIGCFVENHRLLNLLNKALPHDANGALANSAKQNQVMEQVLASLGRGAGELGRGLAASHGVSATATSGAQLIARTATAAARELPRVIASESTKPLTIGVGESFTATLTVAAYFALLISMPFLLYQLYAFLLPALKPEEKRVALPAMIAAPLLFVVGAGFTFFAILPPAIHFLQGYNDKEFYVLVGAGTYYKFEVLMMGAIGLAFEVPLLLLALQRIGVVSSKTLTLNWRYGIVIIAVIGAALPGSDPVSMILETVPLLLLYLASIVLLRVVERRERKRAVAAANLGS